MEQKGHPRGRGKMGKGDNGRQIRKHANVAGRWDMGGRNVGTGRRNAKHVGKRDTSKGFVGTPIQNHRNQKGKGRGIKGEEKGERDQTNQKENTLLQPSKSHGVARVEQ